MSDKNSASRSTNGGSSSDGESINDQDELELMLAAGPEELFQLMASDPAYYLDLLERQQNQELQHRFRCFIKRNQNQTLNIKFKIFEDDRWVEIGHFEDMNDSEVYKEFSTHVDLLLQRSSAMIERAKRPHIEAELGEINDISSKQYRGRVNKNIPEPNRLNDVKSETDFSKIKRDFMAKKLTTPPESKEDFANWLNNKQQQIKENLNEKSDDESEVIAHQILLSDYKNKLIDCLAQQMTQIRQSKSEQLFNHTTLLERLDKISHQCPEVLRTDFTQLKSGLNNNYDQQFYNEVNQIAQIAPTQLKPLFDNFLCKIILNSNQRLDPYVYSHQDLIKFLQLDNIDLKLIKEYKINLVKLWNDQF